MLFVSLMFAVPWVISSLLLMQPQRAATQLQVYCKASNIKKSYFSAYTIKKFSIRYITLGCNLENDYSMNKQELIWEHDGISLVLLLAN